MRQRVVIAGSLVLVLVAAVGLYLGFRHVDDKLDLALPDFGPACRVTADGQVRLDAVQMANAATIAAVGIRKKIPERGVIVALATAYQESSLENLPDGDRDSIGLFQQRPSQGWGTVEEINDPRYAAGKFYDKLKRVKGWEKMRVTDAAQKVQLSAYPEAYEKWADEATVLTRALLGNATGAVACTISGAPVRRGADALTALTTALKLDWGRPQTAAAAAGFSLTAADPKTGWRYAHWLVSHATDHGVQTIRYGDLQWNAADGRWSPAAQPSATVGVTVYG